MKTAFLYAAALSVACASGAPVDIAGPDTWAGEDALGRKVGLYEGPRNGKKEVLLFYWTWHDGQDAPGAKVKNITQIVLDNPDAMSDGFLPCWRENLWANRFHWDEPLFGYYKTWDRWVLRKHADMLAAAGVDAVFFDCTNGSQTWDRSTEALMAEWDNARCKGAAVPKIAFMLPFHPSPHSLVSLRHLYKTIYKPGRYRELWYMRDGKPCIMAYPDNLTDSAEDREIRAFFAFRPGQPDYVRGAWRGDQWGWLENYPQHGYRKTADGRPELVTVGVAQNACPETRGHCSAFNLPGSHSRSYTKRNGFDRRPDSYLYGANFLEQWDRAYELDPDVVFVTGWNEWTAGMWFRKDGWTGKPFSFVDQFDADRSRDLEPVKRWGGKGDAYYLLFTDRVRKFKGLGRVPRASAPKTIDMASRESWADVSPIYADPRGDTRHRDSDGYGETHYADKSGRNDIVEARVARDAQSVYFMVRAAQTLTPCTDRAWMTLFIDTDRDRRTGWQGYDIIVNRVAPRAGRAVAERHCSTRGNGLEARSTQRAFSWREAASVEMSVLDDMLVLKLPRALFGAGEPSFEFKWGDNLKLEGDVMDFYVSGDCAPLGRFNFVYAP